MPLERIETIDDARLDMYARLTEVQLRNRLEPQKGIFISESFKVIERALDAGYEPLSLLMEEKRISESSAIIARVNQDTPIFILPSLEIEKLTGFELTRGILAAFSRPAMRPIEELLVDARRVAVLEGLVDHTNVGALFRSAAALGIDAVILTPTCCDPLYRRATRVSMGTVFQIPWTRIGETSEDWPKKGMDILRSFDFKTAALALSDKAIALDDEKLTDCDKLAFIFGTEGDGLASTTLAESDFIVRIPMYNQVDSLNVAAASAVVFWELCRSKKT